MPAEVLAITAATLYAATQILMKIGTQDTSVMAGLLVSLATGSLASVVATLLLAQEPLTTEAIIPFVIAGLFGAAFGRILTIVAVDRLGPSVSVPVQGSVYPMSAVIIGVVFLDEAMTGVKVVGLGLLLVGVWLLSRLQTTPASTQVSARISRRVSPRLRRGIAFPLMAGICYAAADYFRKQGITAVPEPITGTAIGVTSSLIFWLVAIVAAKRLRTNMRYGPGLKFFALSGLTAAAAVLSVIQAFETGAVSTISPIVASQPLPTLILSAIFLRGIERITQTVVLGAISVVVAVILITI